MRGRVAGYVWTTRKLKNSSGKDTAKSKNKRFLVLKLKAGSSFLLLPKNHSLIHSGRQMG